MTRPLPAVPIVNLDQPITAGIWNSFVYATGYHTRPPAALLWQSTSQAVPSITTTRLSFDGAERDSDAGHDPTANPSRYTVTNPGIYRVSVGAGLMASDNSINTAGGERSVAITVNEAAIWAIMLMAPHPSGDYYGTCSIDIPMNAGDYVESQVWQDSGAAFKTLTGAGKAFMAVRWVAAL